MGFISDLPTELVAAFRATLEEVAEADVILHVRDIAHPDTAAQKADVLGVLAGMVTDGTLDPDWPKRTIDVLNKADLLGGVSEVPGLVEDRKHRRHLRAERRRPGRLAGGDRRAAGERQGSGLVRARAVGRGEARLALSPRRGADAGG